MVSCAVISVVHFLRVVTAAVQCPNFVIGHIGNQCFQFRGIEEMFAHVRAVFGFVSLVVAVQTFFHAFAQDTVFVFCQEAVPTATPNDFDNIPACAGKVAFQFLDDFAVTADRTVQTLQVTVDDENKVVQTFACCQCDGALRFRFIHFAVAAETPYFTAFGFCQAAGFQVFQETGLVNRHDRTQTHRYGRKLPEIRQQVRMRVRRQTMSIHFLTEIIQLVFSQTAFNESAGIDAWRNVALEEYQITFFAFAFSFPEVVETHFIHGCCGLERCDMTTQLQIFFTGAQYDGGGVPAHECTDAVFDVLIARNAFFVFNRNGIQIRGGCAVRHTDAFVAAVFNQMLQQVLCAFAAFVF